MEGGFLKKSPPKANHPRRLLAFFKYVLLYLGNMYKYGNALVSYVQDLFRPLEC